MKTEIICQSCTTENVVIDNRLFFPETENMVPVYCSACKSEINSFATDGWFFVQSKEEYLFELKIEKQKEELKYVPLITSLSR